MTVFGDDTKGAMPYLERSFAIDPNHPRTCNLLGISYVTEGERPKGKEYLRRMVQLDPMWMQGLESYVEFLARGGNDLSDTTDLSLLRKSLTLIIEAPPESGTKLHLDQSERKVRQARQLLDKVERRTKELQAIH